MSGHPYRFPGQPSGTYSYGRGDSEVVVYELYGGHHSIEKVWPIEDYRKVYRHAPQDLVVPIPARKVRWYQLADGRIVGRYE